MKIYSIYEIGHKDMSRNIRLPAAGRPTEIAVCSNVPSDPPLRGTGDGWEEIDNDTAAKLMGW